MCEIGGCQSLDYLHLTTLEVPYPVFKPVQVQTLHPSDKMIRGTLILEIPIQVVHKATIFIGPLAFGSNKSLTAFKGEISVFVVTRPEAVYNAAQMLKVIARN